MRTIGPTCSRSRKADQEQKQLDQREANRTRLRPSSVEIARMEQSIPWPLQYLREFPQLVRTVQQVAVARMRDLEDAAKRWNGEGLGMIADGLRRDRVRIF